ncbi:MAG: hypothetical protein AB7O68_26440, partial [Pirellulales bacterium]
MRKSEPSRLILALATSLCLACATDSPDEPQSASQDDSAKQARLNERVQCLARARQLEQAGKLPEAIAAAEQARAIEHDVYG